MKEFQSRVKAKLKKKTNPIGFALKVFMKTNK
jgi:hypothetical protein